MKRRILMALAIWSGAWLTGCTATAPVHVLRERADRLYRFQDYAGAAQEYAAITARYPGDWRAQHRLGLCLTETGDLATARRCLEVAHTARPQSPEVADALAEVLYRQGEADRLFAFLRDRAGQRQTVSAYRRLARYAIELSDYDTAKLAIKTAIALNDGKRVEPYLDAASFYAGLGQLDLAVERLRQAYGVDPYDERVLEQLRAMGEVPGPTLALPPVVAAEPPEGD